MIMNTKKIILLFKMFCLFFLNLTFLLFLFFVFFSWNPGSPSPSDLSWEGKITLWLKLLIFFTEAIICDEGSQVDFTSFKWEISHIKVGNHSTKQLTNESWKIVIWLKKRIIISCSPEVSLPLQLSAKPIRLSSVNSSTFFFFYRGWVCQVIPAQGFIFA